MIYEALKDFKKVADVPQDLISEYEDLVRETYFDGNHATPVMITAFGDIVIHDGTIGKLVNLLYRYKGLKV